MFDPHRKIREYKSGRLSGEELEQFEQLLETDALLRNLVENSSEYDLISDALINNSIRLKLKIVISLLDSPKIVIPLLQN